MRKAESDGQTYRYLSVIYHKMFHKFLLLEKTDRCVQGNCILSCNNSTVIIPSIKNKTKLLQKAYCNTCLLDKHYSLNSMLIANLKKVWCWAASYSIVSLTFWCVFLNIFISFSFLFNSNFTSLYLSKKYLVYCVYNSDLLTRRNLSQNFFLCGCYYCFYCHC